MLVCGNVEMLLRRWLLLVLLSPTCSNDALMMSLAIAAYENRKLATCDVAGAYLHADMDDFVVIKILGQVVEILCAKNPCFKEFVVMENGKKRCICSYLKRYMAVSSWHYFGMIYSWERWWKWA